MMDVTAERSQGPRPPRTRSLLLVDDHELVRFGTKALCAEILEQPVEWIEAGTLAEALKAYAERPDIDLVLLDLNLADCKGLQGLRRFLAAHPDARIAVFSATQDEFVVRQARALGAAGYVPKGSASADVQAMLRTLLEGELAPPAGGRAARGAAGPFPAAPANTVYDRVAELGSRHLEILELVLSGCTNQEISRSMQLSLGTVKNYVSALLLALDVKSRAHLVSLFH
jgi:DNA-binding NarL/FixJ family response regulator